MVISLGKLFNKIFMCNDCTVDFFIKKLEIQILNTSPFPVFLSEVNQYRIIFTVYNHTHRYLNYAFIH